MASPLGLVLLGGETHPVGKGEALVAGNEVHAQLRLQDTQAIHLLATDQALGYRLGIAGVSLEEVRQIVKE